jgi:hypothetical protein
MRTPAPRIPYNLAAFSSKLTSGRQEAKQWQIKVIDCLRYSLNQLLTPNNINVAALLKFQN